MLQLRRSLNPPTGTTIRTTRRSYGGDVGSEHEEEEWGDLEEAEVGLDQTHRDWQERIERKKGKKGKNKG